MFKIEAVVHKVISLIVTVRLKTLRSALKVVVDHNNMQYYVSLAYIKYWRKLELMEKWGLSKLCERKVTITK